MLQNKISIILKIIALSFSTSDFAQNPSFMLSRII